MSIQRSVCLSSARRAVPALPETRERRGLGVCLEQDISFGSRAFRLPVGPERFARLSRQMGRAYGVACFQRTYPSRNSRPSLEGSSGTLKSGAGCATARLTTHQRDLTERQQRAGLSGLVDRPVERVLGAGQDPAADRAVDRTQRTPAGDTPDDFADCFA